MAWLDTVPLSSYGNTTAGIQCVRTIRVVSHNGSNKQTTCVCPTPSHLLNKPPHMYIEGLRFKKLYKFHGQQIKCKCRWIADQVQASLDSRSSANALESRSSASALVRQAHLIAAQAPAPQAPLGGSIDGLGTHGHLPCYAPYVDDEPSLH